MPVIIADKCSRQLLDAFQSKVEVGGFLLGNRYGNTYYMEEILISRYGGTQTSFEAQPSDFVQDLERRLKEHPEYQIIGIWHTHPNGDNCFSMQDEETNRAYAAVLDGCLSVLVNHVDSFSVFVISENGVCNSFDGSIRKENMYEKRG